MANIIITKNNSHLKSNQLTIMLDSDDIVILNGAIMHCKDMPAKTGVVISGDTNTIVLNIKEERQ